MWGSIPAKGLKIVFLLSFYIYTPNAFNILSCLATPCYPGIACIKAMAHSHVWWPGIDNDIKWLSHKCTQCFKTKKSSPAAPLAPWTLSTIPWERVHIDFATYRGDHFLIMVDGHSKWPEVIGPIPTTNVKATTDALRVVFARYGLPSQVVSDNGPPFLSTEYSEFLKENGVQCILVSPYHPASSGLAERFVQTFKQAMLSSASGPLQQRLQNFLLTCIQKHFYATTGCSLL